MSRISQTIYDIHHIDVMAERDTWLNRIHPLAKLLITILYMVLVMSFDKYNLIGLAGMSLYPIVLMISGEISFRRAFHRLWIVLLAIAVLGIANPILERTVIFHIGTVGITSGMISLVTLVMKAGFAVFASYLLIETTSIEGICYAMRIIHIPKVIVTLVMLIYRYIILMLKETERVTQAYSMRAPKQKGIHHRAWGSLVGQMLLRSIDRAELVYESMTLRGFCGEFYLRGTAAGKVSSILYGLIFSVCLIGLRIFPVFLLVGTLF